MEASCPTTTKVERKRTAEGKLLNQYLLLKRIGEGPHAKIKLAQNTLTKELVAIKKFSLYLLKKKTKQVKLADGSCSSRLKQFSTSPLSKISSRKLKSPRDCATKTCAACWKCSTTRKAASCTWSWSTAPTAKSRNGTIRNTPSR